MQFYYGEQMPLRVLDEAEFWKRQESEHTVVIREAFDDLEASCVEALKKWEKEILCWACERNDTETAQLLLQRGVDPSCANQKVKVFL